MLDRVLIIFPFPPPIGPTFYLRMCMRAHGKNNNDKLNNVPRHVGLQTDVFEIDSNPSRANGPLRKSHILAEALKALRH